MMTLSIWWSRGDPLRLRPADGPAQVARVLAKTCQAKADFAARLRRMSIRSPNRCCYQRPRARYCNHWLSANTLNKANNDIKIP